MKFRITLIDVIIMAIVLSIVGGFTYYGVQKERKQMSVESYKNIPGIAVNVEKPEDVYKALGEMSEQAYENIDPNSKLGMWLADKMEEMHQKFDLDEID